ncbi:polymer-forming cytoskeletal protein [candidate division WOR-3 bacterium]|nr:polymer-forming cytoskeletal protein [candidate division WOR-3 bacterium]
MRFHRLSVLVVCLLAALPAAAARLAGGSTFALGRSETLLTDLYFGGTVLRLEGRLDGSAVAGCQSADVAGEVTRNLYVASQNFDLSGTLGGDLLAFCATLNVTGAVNGALRTGCGTLYLNGRVGRDLVAGCQSLTVARSAEIQGDVLAGCGTLDVSGIVRGDLRASAGEIIISGQIDGDVDVTVGDRLILTDDARVFGSLRYCAERELDLGNRDAVFGDITFRHRLPADRVKVGRPLPVPAVLWPLALYSLLAALVITVILVAVWKHQLNAALEACFTRFGRAVGFGALGFFATPVALAISMVLVVTIPAALICGVGYLVAVYLAKILAGMLLGRALFRFIRQPNASLWAAAPVGVVLVYALCAIPFAGWLFWLFSVLLGFGIVIELLARTRQRPV